MTAYGPGFRGGNIQPGGASLAMSAIILRYAHSSI